MNIQWEHTSPVSIDTIETVAKANHIQLPKALTDIILKGNNGFPNRHLFDSRRGKRHIFRTLLSYNKEEVENVYTALEALKESDAHSNLYPIANDPAGNFICLDGHHVVLWNHETETTDFVADDVVAFFNSLY